MAQISRATRQALALVADEWGAIRAARAAHLNIKDGPPAGVHHFTTYEYMDEFGVSRQTAETQLQGMVRSGVLKKGSAQRVATNGSLRWQCVYWRPND